MMILPLRRPFVTLLLLLTVLCVTEAQTPAPASSTKKTAAEKLAKLAAPWPDAATLEARRVDAENRALFKGPGPLEFTLESDFTAVNKDRNPNSTKLFPAVLKVPGAAGEPKSITLNIGARGHLRRMSATCSFVPLRLEFAKDAVKGTAFEGPATALKLVTHCQGSKENEQYVLREYLAYQLSNIMTAKSFRARLARVTYVDSKTKKTLTTRYGMLLEDDNDVARRMGGRTVALERTVFTDLDPATLAQMMVFEYMLGNADFSIYGLHNVVIVQTPARVLYPVAYDFDLSGLVHAPYALPPANMGLKSVLERIYRGPCLTAEQLEPTLAVFRAKKNDMMAALNSIPDMDSAVRSEVKAYLDDFYSTIERPSGVKRFFIDGCKRTTM
jgi:hypothetical protein